ncbi:MAG: hypothetical protein KKB25_03540, partial [Nanoarchaeota archaeon]|nr:hypothetical protein [Nanoarchaeota archaeon]
MSHKAISTFVAAVILAAFTVSAAIMVTSFLTGVIKFQTTSVSSQAVCAQKGALLIDTAMCTRVRDSSLVGYWKLDSVNASNYTVDSSGYGNDGRLYNGSTSCFNSTGCINLTAGQINSGLQFDGV